MHIKQLDIRDHSYLDNMMDMNSSLDFQKRKYEIRAKQQKSLKAKERTRSENDVSNQK